MRPLPCWLIGHGDPLLSSRDNPDRGGSPILVWICPHCLKSLGETTLDAPRPAGPALNRVEYFAAQVDRARRDVADAHRVLDLARAALAQREKQLARAHDAARAVEENRALGREIGTR